MTETETFNHDFMQFKSMDDTFFLEIPDNNICLEPHIGFLTTSNIPTTWTDSQYSDLIIMSS